MRARQNSSSRKTRGSRLLTATALFLALAAYAPTEAAPNTESSTGLLRWPGDQSQLVTNPPVVGYYISHGGLIATNEDPVEEAALTDAKLAGGDGQLTVKEAYVVPLGSDQDDTWTFGIGFYLPPMPGDPAPLSESQRQKWEARKPLAGYRVRPGETVNLLVLVDMNDLRQGGKSEWVEVDYTQGGRRERLRIDAAIEVPSAKVSTERPSPLNCL